MDYVELFTRDERRRNLSPKTIHNRDNVFSLYSRWLRGRNLDVGDVSKEIIEEWVDSRNVAARTRRAYISSLRALYQFIAREGLGEDPTTLIIPPRTGRLLPRPIAVEHLELALAEADARMRLWLSLGAFMGFRCAEIANLTREQVLNTNDPPLIVVHGKGDKDRMVPLNALVESAMRAYELPRAGWLFPVSSKRCGAIRPGTVSGMISVYLHDLGIPATAHQLRHYFATTLYAATCDIRITQEMLGHSSPKTTAIYVQYDSARAASAVRSLGLRPAA